MKILKAVIVDDENRSRKSLNNLLNDFCEGIEVVGLAGGVEEAISVISDCKPDVVFLDIELQPGTGFDVVSALTPLTFEIIFTTAFEQYAIKAIKISSLDYLLKPISIEELNQAVQKCHHKRNDGEYHSQLDVLMSELNNQKKEDSKICLSTSEGMEFVKISKILYCEASGSYTTFVFDDGKLLVSKHLKEYENMLIDHPFMRVHNSFLINLLEVKKFVKSEGGYILMNNGDSINISPKKRDAFMDAMMSI